MQKGEVLEGRFEIEEQAQAGGMGAVFRARDRQGGDVAVKVLRGAVGEGATVRFTREAEALAELTHPHIVRYVAHGHTAEGDPFLVMEWLEGETLSARLKRGTFGVADAVAFGIGLGEALGAAHGRGIVHRDVKPANIILIGDRAVDFKLVDFGLARRDSDGITRTGMLLGTPGYMAPEQARGERDVDARADVFAMGCVMFRCLTGRAAFPGENAVAMLAKVLLEPAPRVRSIRADVPVDLDDLVARMLDRDPSRRPAHGAAVALMLAAIELEASIESRSVPSMSTLTARERRFSSIVFVGDGTETMADARVSPSTQLSRATGIATRFGGRLENLADGELVIALGGTASEQAVNAARCALALRSVVPAPIAIATARTDDADQHPFGEVIDRAAHLLRSIGGPSLSIRVDDVTAGLLDARFDVVRREDVYELEREHDIVEVPRTLLGKSTPFVGRARELGALLALLDECIDEPVARAAIVTAPPGAGKTRLRQELVRKIADRGDAQVWLARGDPMSARASLGLVAQMIRRTAGVREGGGPDSNEKLLSARVLRTVDHGDATRVAEFLGELAFVPFEGASVRLRAARSDAMLLGEQMRRAWEDFVRAECAASALVIILEHLHWGDLASVKLVESALRALQDRPLFVVAFARPEVHEAFPNLWQDRAVPVPLGELTRKASERLVVEVLGSNASTDVVSRIIDRAAGNAFYLEELIRSVASGENAMPETILAMAETRMSALEPEARRALRAASVFGQVFWKGGVDALAGEHAISASDWLEDLARREVIVARTTARFPGEREYAFRHALVRDAAYAMLTEADRAVGHRVAAEWLVSAGETDPLVLAAHFEHGGDARATEWYRRAAAQALAANDFDGVIAHVDRAMAGPIGEELGALLVLQAEARRWRGEYAEADAAAMRARSLVSRGSVAWWTAMSELASSGLRAGFIERVHVVAADAADAPVSEDAAHASIVALLRLTNVARVAGDPIVADRLARAERDWEAMHGDDPLVEARISMARGLQVSHRGDASAQLTCMELAATAFERAGDDRGAIIARVNAGCANIELGRHADAARVLAAEAQRADRLGLRELAGGARHNLGVALGRDRAFADALLVVSEARETVRAIHHKRIEIGCTISLAEIHLASGDRDAAETEARRGVDLAQSFDVLSAHALGVLSRVLLDKGDVPGALEAARAASRLVEDLGGIETGEAIVRLALARAIHATGDLDAAREAIGVARARLVARADCIANADLRASFLENVPENAETIALAAKWANP